MDKHVITEHPNSAFTRYTRKMSLPNIKGDNKVHSDVSINVESSARLTARQIAFREIKKLFGTGCNQNNTKKQS
jgi:hypothetical protein